jgi:hypothetical protein
MELKLLRSVSGVGSTGACMPTGATAADAAGVVVELVGIGAAFVRTGESEGEGGLEGLACWAEASAVERITRANGRRLEVDRRSMVIRK